MSEYAPYICLCLSSVNSRLNMLISGRSMYVRLCVFRCLFNRLCVHVCEVLVHVYKLSACLFVYQKSFKGSLYVKSGFLLLSEYLVSTLIICRKPNLNLINRTPQQKQQQQQQQQYPVVTKINKIHVEQTTQIHSLSQTNTHTNTHTHTHTHTRARAYIHIYTHTHMHSHTCTPQNWLYCVWENKKENKLAIASEIISFFYTIKNNNLSSLLILSGNGLFVLKKM